VLPSAAASPDDCFDQPLLNTKTMKRVLCSGMLK
jgi:hypothetical protein